jgi:hypothetical protein
VKERGVRNSQRWLTAIAVLGSLLLAGSPALAAQAAPAAAQPALAGQHPAAHLASPALVSVGSAGAPTTGSAYICLTNSNPLECLKSNGTSNQVTITSNSTGWAIFSLSYSASKGYQFENGLGNCLRAGTGNVVKIEDGGCAAGDSADWWTATSANRLKSDQYGDYMKTVGQTSGNNVWHDSVNKGDWPTWSFAS